MPPKKDLECYTKKRLPQNGGGTYTTCVEGQKKPKFKVVKKINPNEKFLEQVEEDNKQGGKVSNLLLNANQGFLTGSWAGDSPSQRKEKERRKFKTKVAKLILKLGKYKKFNAQRFSIFGLVKLALEKKAITLEEMKKLYEDYMYDMEYYG